MNRASKAAARRIIEQSARDAMQWKGRGQFQQARALELLENCSQVGVPPPRDLIALIRLLLDNPPATGAVMFSEVFGVRHDYRTEYFRCIELEAAAPPDGQGLRPSTLSTRKLAEQMGVTRDTMKRWRRELWYRQEVARRRG